ncbi:Terminase-like family protein [Synechococcus sp. MIT S9509]|uniref:hypothetical protein n=1 Tax=Synechococcus sp. MIT S9509 TaxID=1801630 RepID=UPI0007BB87BC|nr:hypothetical protein [Synechococcus sp. MIT S9509]KZR93109.1 Terminase-like family protein [Synechococcus sp. MIT S9509]
MTGTVAAGGSTERQILQTNPFQQILLDVPLNDVICAGTAKATGKSFWIVLRVIRDAQIVGKDFHALITRSSFQALQEVQTLLYRYLTAAYPGTTWNSAENMFRIGGRSAPRGTVELAYTASSPLEQIRAAQRLQGRSKSLLIHDEAGTQPSPDFYDQLQGVLRAPQGVPTSVVFLANPGGPGHVWLKNRFAIPAGLPDPMRPVRFWSEEYGKHCVFLTANASINKHIDWEAYKRQVELMAGGDPAMEAALLEGRWDQDLGGAFFASCWSPGRCRRVVRPGDINLREHNPRPFVCLDWGVANPMVAYLCIPNPPDAPKGSILLADEFYVSETDRSGRRSFLKGVYMSNAEQAEGLREWLWRWGVTPTDIRIVADDAIWNATGGHKGSVAGDFRSAGVPMTRAEKMLDREASGLSVMRNMMAATDKDPSRPWLLWSPACEGWEATIPSLPRHPRDPEVIADGVPNHSCDAARMGIMWYQRKWPVGKGPRFW